MTETSTPAIPLVFNIMLKVAAWMCFAMMALTFCDVMMRYFLSRPIMGAFEITEILMGCIVFLAAPAMSFLGENIVVTVISERLPARLQRPLQIVADLFCALLAAGVAIQLWRHGSRLLRYHEVSMELGVPKGWIAHIMAAGMAITAVAFLLRIVMRRDGPARDQSAGMA